MHASSFFCSLLLLVGSSLAHPTASADPCAPTKYVVLSSHEIAPYDASLHGTSPTLRLFDKRPNANCYKKTDKTVVVSPRTDLQVRDPRTSLMLYDRGILGWAASLLKFTPFGFLATALSIGECSLAIYNAATKEEQDWYGPGLCIASLCLGTLGAVFPSWDSISKALNGGNANVASSISASPSSFTFVGDPQFYDSIELNTYRKRDGLNSSALNEILSIFNAHIPLYHANDDRQARVWHLFAANETHPIHVYPYGIFPTNNHTIRVWSENTNNTGAPFRFHTMTKIPYGNSTLTNNSTETKRACDPAGQDTICIGDNENIPAGAPDQAYYGFDLYGSESAINEWEDDFGTTEDGSNGFPWAMRTLGQDIYDANAWDTCICMETNNQYISTGSLQLSWDYTYNGYSECWNAGCDGA